MLVSGTILQKRYRIVNSIGGGGMGTVYLAQDARLLDRPCAIKELSLAQVHEQDAAHEADGAADDECRRGPP